MLVHYKALTPVYFHFLISLKNEFHFSCLVINLLHMLMIVVFMSVFNKIVTELRKKKFYKGNLFIRLYMCVFVHFFLLCLLSLIPMHQRNLFREILSLLSNKLSLHHRLEKRDHKYMYLAVN